MQFKIAKGRKISKCAISFKQKVRGQKIFKVKNIKMIRREEYKKSNNWNKFYTPNLVGMVKLRPLEF